jgi:hypothetical protein
MGLIIIAAWFAQSLATLGILNADMRAFRYYLDDRYRFSARDDRERAYEARKDFALALAVSLLPVIGLFCALAVTGFAFHGWTLRVGTSAADSRAPRKTEP